VTNPDQPAGNSHRVLHDRKGKGIASILGWFLLLVSAPAVFLAMCTFTGLGLLQNVPSHNALLVAFGISILPALGLATFFGSFNSGSSMAIRAGALLLWSLMLLSALPSYFPEQREPAARAGLRLLAMPLSSETGEKVVATGLSMLEVFGPEPVAIVKAERSAPTPAPGESKAAPSARRSGRNDDPEGEKLAPSSTTRIKYEGDGRSIRIPVHADGPEFGEDLTFIFDTGATLTTLDRRTLDLLDIPIPVDAPTVVVHTAAGEMEASLVLVDAVWLGDEVTKSSSGSRSRCANPAPAMVSPGCWDSISLVSFVSPSITTATRSNSLHAGGDATGGSTSNPGSNSRPC